MLNFLDNYGTEVSLDKQQRQIINTRYISLVNQYEALNQQLDNCLDAGEKVVLKQRIDIIDSESQALDQLLRREEPSNLQDKLHYIDFKKPVQAVQGLLEDSGKVGGVSLFIVQNSRNMAGDLLMLRLREVLRNDANLTPYRVSFSEGIELNEVGLLKGISKYFGVDTSGSDLDEMLSSVVNKICASVQTRSILLLEIAEWHRLPAQDQVFSWLCSDFYSRLSSQFATDITGKWRRVHIFIVVVSDERVSDECLQICQPFSPIVQDSESTKSERIFNISLENWSKEDIEDWLEFAGLSEERLVVEANRLYEGSVNGIPLIVQTAIERDFIYTNCLG